MNVKLYGPRVLLEREKPKEKGTLLIPDNPNAIHSLARVVHVGDGRVRLHDGTFKTIPMRVKVGDIVFFQTNALIASACSYVLEGKSLLTLMQDDLLIRFPTTDITVEDAEMLGDWTMVEPFIRQPGKIILPHTLNYQEHLEHTYWKFLKAAPGSDFEVQPGYEVIVNAHRATPVQMGKKAYCYIDRSQILGVGEKVEEPEVAGNVIV